MKYSLRYILDTRYDPNRSKERKIEERQVVINAIGKIISPYPTYVYLNLGLRPDWITFLSFAFIIAGALSFFCGEATWGALFLLLFFIHDSVDGDMARVSGRKSSYGALFDSFGADILYSLVPLSIGYYLYTAEVSFLIFEPPHLFVVGALTSISFLFYRLMNAKSLNFFWDKKGKEEKSVFENKETSQGVFGRLAKIYRHGAIRGNFFAEPGIVTWTSIFVFTGRFDLLGGYLILVLLYNLGYLLPNFFRVYLSFLRYEQKK